MLYIQSYVSKINCIFILILTIKPFLQRMISIFIHFHHATQRYKRSVAHCQYIQTPPTAAVMQHTIHNIVYSVAWTDNVASDSTSVDYFLTLINFYRKTIIKIHKPSKLFNIREKNVLICVLNCGRDLLFHHCIRNWWMRQKQNHVMSGNNSNKTKLQELFLHYSTSETKYTKTVGYILLQLVEKLPIRVFLKLSYSPLKIM